MKNEDNNMHLIDEIKKFLPNSLKQIIARGIFKKTVDRPIGILNKRYKIIDIPENPVIGKDACTAKL